MFSGLTAHGASQWKVTAPDVSGTLSPVQPEPMGAQPTAWFQTPLKELPVGRPEDGVCFVHTGMF